MFPGTWRVQTRRKNETASGSPPASVIIRFRAKSTSNSPTTHSDDRPALRWQIASAWRPQTDRHDAAREKHGWVRSRARFKMWGDWSERSRKERKEQSSRQKNSGATNGEFVAPQRKEMKQVKQTGVKVVCCLDSKAVFRRKRERPEAFQLPSVTDSGTHTHLDRPNARRPCGRRHSKPNNPKALAMPCDDRPRQRSR